MQTALLMAAFTVRSVDRCWQVQVMWLGLTNFLALRALAISMLVQRVLTMITVLVQAALAMGTKLDSLGGMGSAPGSLGDVRSDPDVLGDVSSAWGGLEDADDEYGGGLLSEGNDQVLGGLLRVWRHLVNLLGVACELSGVKVHTFWRGYSGASVLEHLCRNLRPKTEHHLSCLAEPLVWKLPRLST